MLNICYIILKNNVVLHLTAGTHSMRHSPTPNTKIIHLKLPNFLSPRNHSTLKSYHNLRLSNIYSPVVSG